MHLPRLIEATVLARAAQFRVLTLTGPRQSGKTTLARHLFADKPYFALDRPDVQSILRADPLGALGRFLPYASGVAWQRGVASMRVPGVADADASGRW